MSVTVPLQIAPRATITPADLPRVDVLSLYVHIPFCFHKCHYCDFYSITRQNDERMHRFVDRILREADLWTTSAGPSLSVQTVFFGGGTPTLLPLQHMQRLLEGLKARFDFSPLKEWTVEANPATVTDEYCRMLRSQGVDRLSFGAQSFDLNELKTLERHHEPSDVPRSVELARSAGFSRLNLDLIYAIPGQSMDSWQSSLEQTIAIGTPHISCYGLTYEPNTPIAVKKRLGQLHCTEESLELEMLHYTRQRLTESGRQPYEISNYATPSEECLHNLAYWLGDNYIALGPSGSSHVQGNRWKNRPHLGEWESAIDKDILPATDVEKLSVRQRAGELAMLMLRLERGLIFDDYATRTGLDASRVFARQIDHLARLNLIEVDNRRLRLSRAGLNVADAIAAEFLISD